MQWKDNLIKEMSTVKILKETTTFDMLKKYIISEIEKLNNELDERWNVGRLDEDKKYENTIIFSIPSLDVSKRGIQIEYEEDVNRIFFHSVNSNHINGITPIALMRSSTTGAEVI